MANFGDSVEMDETLTTDLVYTDETLRLINPGGGIQFAKPPGFRSTARRTGSEGMIARLQPIKGVTPKKVLSHRIWLPAVLNTVILTENALHNEYDTLSAGQFSQAAQGDIGVHTQLRDLPLETLTLAYDPSWIVVKRQNPLRLRDTLFRILRSRHPVHLLAYFHPSKGERILNVAHPVHRPEFDFNVTLRSGTREIRPGEHDTHYMTFALKEWRDPRVRVRSSRPKGGNSGRKKGVHLPTRHKLKANDTLASLSKEYYGTYQHWRLIASVNGIKHPRQKQKLASLGGRWKVGVWVKIPALPKHHNPTGGAGLAEDG